MLPIIELELLACKVKELIEPEDEYEWKPIKKEANNNMSKHYSNRNEC